MKFQRPIFFVFVIGLGVSIAAFIQAWFSSEVSRLSNIGGYVSGISTIFGILMASFALYAYVYSEDSYTQAAKRAWIAKLRLEDALHTYAVLLKVAATSDATNLGTNHPLINQSLENVKFALEEARKNGLYRVLAIRDRQSDKKFNVAYEMSVVEAHVREDLSNDREGIGGSTVHILPDLYDGLIAINEQDMRNIFTRKKLPNEPIEEIKKLFS